ncbi:hypothetical protein M409DRAFT_21355 [Zasmidium cellare ATCC 36951]|uniref:non-specific serine/threonine protein kinase n=1 Tax=Zasmidium cellare ATCC 36951 TaxID=1080233 RepID=A0A6A6CS65_ZASCE|nr:uncharacterized protein M409DRAFT_21355 [Zasmidium cellare ATCC 36951]KAF2168609.1 hypothetical protein M409DRAFT_21355 [Zasmidium cellare ATCC 36951]
MATSKRKTRAGKKLDEKEGKSVSPPRALSLSKAVKKRGPKTRAARTEIATSQDDEAVADPRNDERSASLDMPGDGGEDADGAELSRPISKGKGATNQTQGKRGSKRKQGTPNDVTARAGADVPSTIREEVHGGGEGVFGGPIPPRNSSSSPTGSIPKGDSNGEPEDRGKQRTKKRHRRPRESTGDSLQEDGPPPKKRNVGTTNEPALSGAGEHSNSHRELVDDDRSPAHQDDTVNTGVATDMSQPQVDLRDHNDVRAQATADGYDYDAAEMARDRQRLLDHIAKGKPASQPVEDYLHKYEPAGERLIYFVLLNWIGKHGFGADWSQATPIDYYVEDLMLPFSEKWGPLPRAFDGNDPETRELMEYWRTCRTAPACRGFVRRALTNEKLAQEYTLAHRIHTCLEVIRRHPSTDQTLWEASPEPERYLSGLFPLGEEWPLTYEGLRHAWSTSRAQLDERGEVSPVLHVEFADLYRWAQGMFKQKGLYLAPDDPMPDDTVENCVRQHMRDWLRHGALFLLKPLWDDSIRDSQSEEQRQFLQQEYEHMEASGELSFTVEWLTWKREWEHIENRLAGYDLPHRLRHRFRDFKSMADESLEEYGELLHPPDPESRDWPGAYLDELGFSVRSQSSQNHHQAWNKAIAAAHGPLQVELQLRYEDMLAEVRRGVAMWRPDEQQPPSPDEFRHRTTRSLGFGEDRSQLQRGDHWNFHSVLGEGGHAQAALWVKLDSTMKTTERMVLKDVFMNHENWDSDDHWFGALHDRRPIEERVPMILQGYEDSDNIVRCYGAAIYDSVCMNRIYSEFCPHGDLAGIIRAHRRARHMGLVDENGNRLDHRIPERALWAIFEALVSAVCLLQQGHLPVTGRQRPHDQIPFIHCDIKPHNVFLALADDTDGLWPGIPTPKLGDFGIVEQTELDNPLKYTGTGTPGYRAPETYSRDPDRQAYIEFASDVWAIGLVMYCLVNLIERPLQRDALEYSLEDNPTRFPPAFDQDVTYTDDLLRTISRCLTQRPEDRIWIDDLWHDIHYQVATMEGNTGSVPKLRQPEDGEANFMFARDVYLQWTSQPSNDRIFSMPPRKKTTAGPPPKRDPNRITRANPGGAPAAPAPAVAPPVAPAPAAAAAAPPKRGRGGKGKENATAIENEDDVDEEDREDGEDETVQTKKAGPKKTGRKRKAAGSQNEERNPSPRKKRPVKTGAPIPVDDAEDDDEDDDNDGQGQGPVRPEGSKKDGTRKATDGPETRASKKTKVDTAGNEDQDSAVPGAKQPLVPISEGDDEEHDDGRLNPAPPVDKDAVKETGVPDRPRADGPNHLPIANGEAPQDVRTREPAVGRPGGSIPFGMESSPLPDYESSAHADAAEDAPQGSKFGGGRQNPNLFDGTGDRAVEYQPKRQNSGEGSRPAQAGADESLPPQEQHEAPAESMGPREDVADAPEEGAGLPALSEDDPTEPDDQNVQQAPDASEADDNSDEARFMEEVMAQNLPEDHALFGYVEAFEENYKGHLYGILLRLIERHGYDVNWASNIRPIYEYINDDSLIDEPWIDRSAPPAILDDDVTVSADPNAQALKNLWALADTAHSCRNYIARALDASQFSQKYGVDVRLDVCVGLVFEHGNDNEKLWSAAPPLERYLVNKGSNLTEQWPLDLPTLNQRWQVLRAELMSASPSEDTLRLFDHLRRYAKKQFRKESIFLAPMHWDQTTSAEQFVRSHLRLRINIDAVQLLTPMWEKYIEDAPSEHKIERQNEFRAVRGLMTLNTTTVPHGVREAVFRRQWQDRVNRIKEEEVSAFHWRRFQDCQRMAVDNLRYGELLRPLRWLPDVPAAMFVEELSRDIRRQQMDAIEAAWDLALEQMSDAAQVQGLNRRYKAYRDARLLGRPLFRPDEVQPTADPQVQELQDNFAGDRSDIPDQWSKSEVLGEGGFGTAVLWVKYNARHRIIDRIVLKDAKLKAVRESGEHEFDVQNHWHGPISERVPLEAAVPRTLKQAVDSFHIVECRGWAIFDRYRTYRVYGEFCPHGDLGDVVQAHHRAGSHPHFDQNEHEIDHYIPERALWAIFEALTSAVCIMQRGCVAGGTPSDEPHIHPVIQCDIKPVNVFLAEPQKDFWPGIPVFKLGDFGLVRESTVADKPVDEAWGTRGFRAPEQYRQDPGPFAVHRSDVWGIGKTMLSLVNLERKPDDARFDGDPPRPTDAAWNKYSEELLEEIMSCLHLYPLRRKDIGTLWSRIRTHVWATTGVRDYPLKIVKPGPEDEAQLGYQDDKYRPWVDNM